MKSAAFVALQRHAGGGLQALGQKLAAGLDFGVGGVADHHAGRLEAVGGHAGQATAFEQRAHLAAQRILLGLHLGEAIGLRFLHGGAQARQGVGGQGGVVGVAAFFVGFHDLQPLLQVAGKAGAGGAVDGGAGALAEHHHGAAGRAAPAFLRRGNQHVDAGRLHVDPHRARGDAVEHEQAAHCMHGVGHGAQIVVGQDHAGGGFDMRGKDDGGLFAGDGGLHVGNRRGRPRGLRARAELAGLEHGGRGGNVAPCRKSASSGS